MHAIDNVVMKRAGRRLLLVAVTGAAFAVPSQAASASCEANANGIANSEGASSVASPPACPPALGRPVGGVTGRKIA
jgi:hypothetical protein